MYEEIRIKHVNIKKEDREADLFRHGLVAVGDSETMKIPEDAPQKP